MSAFAFGGFLDLYLFRMGLSESADIKFGLGGDFEIVTAAYEATALNDDDLNTSRAITAENIKASGTAISIRLPIQLQFELTEKINLGVKLVPMFKLSGSGSVESMPTETATDQEKFNASFLEATGLNSCLLYTSPSPRDRG